MIAVMQMGIQVQTPDRITFYAVPCTVRYTVLYLCQEHEAQFKYFPQLNWYQEEDCKCKELGCSFDALTHILLFILTLSRHCTLT